MLFGLDKIHLSTKAVRIDSVFCIYSVYIKQNRWKVSQGLKDVKTDESKEKSININEDDGKNAETETKAETTPSEKPEKSSTSKSADVSSSSSSSSSSMNQDPERSMYDSVAFDLEFEFYIPYESEVEGYTVPSSSIFKVSVCKEDVFLLVAYEYRTRLLVALDVLQDKYFLTTSPVFLADRQQEWGSL